ncbi:MAG: AtpZ/AtpI family protein [Nitrospirae bacterium]|nr:AtpZ/AtpI family protein [Nitrospirota bacterium]
MAPLIDKSIIKAFARAGTVGFHMVISTFVGLAIGYGIDRFLNTSPWFTIIFLVLGVIAGYRELARLAKRASDEPD